LFAAKRAELVKLPGLGDAKFSQLQAVLEWPAARLPKRCARTTLSVPRAVRDFLRLTLANRDARYFCGNA
jgi:DNA repair protein RadC